MQGRSPFRAKAAAKRRCAEALTKSRGNLALAAEMLGCSRQNVHQMVSRHADLQVLCEELTEIKLDVLEDKLFQMATEKSNATAAISILNAWGKTRGWGYYKTDVHYSGAIDHRHLHLHSEKLAALDDSQLARLIEERRAALPTIGGQARGVLPAPVREAAETDSSSVTTSSSEPSPKRG